VAAPIICNIASAAKHRNGGSNIHIAECMKAEQSEFWSALRRHTPRHDGGATDGRGGERIGDRQCVLIDVLTLCGVFRVTACSVSVCFFVRVFALRLEASPFLSLCFLIFCVVTLLRCCFPVCDWSLFVMSFQCIF